MRPRRPHWRIPLRGLSCGLALATLLVGCPRIKQDTTGGTSSADAGAPLDRLSSEDLFDLCADLNDQMRTRFSNRELATFSCTRIFVMSGDSASCAQAVTDCVDNSPEALPTAPRPPEFEIDSAECDAIGACSVGTAAFDDCIEDRFEQTDRLITRMSCGIAGDPEAVDALTAEIDRQRPVPASCSAIDARCGGLL